MRPSAHQASNRPRPSAIIACRRWPSEPVGLAEEGARRAPAGPERRVDRGPRAPITCLDRGHRELPIEARFIGRTVQTSDMEIIEVKFQEIDGLEKVLMCERAG